MTARNTAAAARDSDFTIVPATDADRGRVNRLLDAHYAEYAGPLDREHQPRTFPALDDLGNPVSFHLAVAGDRDLGVLGITRAGEVAEWAVAPGPEAERVADRLLADAESAAREMGAGELSIFVGSEDLVTLRALARRGYREVLPPINVMRVVNFPRLLGAVLSGREKQLAEAGTTAARIRLAPGRYPRVPDPDLFVEVGGGSFTAEAYTDQPVRMTIDTTATDFTEVLLGVVDARRFIFLRSRVRPVSRVFSAVSLVRLLSLDRPWYAPRGERL
jgi:hypothetical protein